MHGEKPTENIWGACPEAARGFKAAPQTVSDARSVLFSVNASVVNFVFVELERYRLRNIRSILSSDAG
jgi:hypothetical protein